MLLRLRKTTIILSGGTIHTGTGDVIENGLVAFSNGKITYAGKASDFKGDRSGTEVIDVAGKHVYPGLIYPTTSLGLVEISGVDVTVDNRETGDLNPNVRTIVAYNTDSHVIPVVRSNGVSYCPDSTNRNTFTGYIEHCSAGCLELERCNL